MDSNEIHFIQSFSLVDASRSRELFFKKVETKFKNLVSSIGSKSSLVYTLSCRYNEQ